MKKIYSCMLAMSAVLTANAQTLTQTSNSQANGDMFSTYQCDSLNIVPGAAGAGAVWNFSTLVPHLSLVSNYTTVTSAAANYPSGALVTAASLSDQSYHLSTPADLKYYGGNFKVQAVLGTFIYSQPAIAAVYPMSLNTTSTAAIAGTINVTSPIPTNGTFTGNSVVLADGSGTLTLPGPLGTFTNVLRVVSSQTINFTTSSSVSGVITRTNYDYYTPSVKAPLLSIATHSFTSSIPGSASTQTIVNVNKDYNNVATGINRQEAAAAEVQVYPNPASSQVHFAVSGKGAKEVHIFDITGKLLESKALTNGTLKLDVSDYNKGVYLYRILSTDGETVKTGKLTVN